MYYSCENVSRIYSDFAYEKKTTFIKLKEGAV